MDMLTLAEMKEKWDSSNKDEQDELLMDGFHGVVDRMMDELFFDRKSHILAEVENEEDIDNYIVESAKKAKARYEDMTKEEAQRKMESRILRNLASMIDEADEEE